MFAARFSYSNELERRIDLKFFIELSLKIY